MRSRYLRLLFATTGYCLALVAILNWVVDPYRVYHASFFDLGYPANQRHLNPGLAKTCHYDSVVIGTSVTENFLVSHVKQRLGWNVLKLSLSGSTAREQHLMLQHALKTGQVRNVLWGIDFFAFDSGPDALRDPGAFLLLDREAPHLRYLLSADSLRETLRGLLGRGAPSLETYSTWYDEYRFSADRVLAEWSALQDGRIVKMLGNHTDLDPAAVHSALEQHLVRTVQRYPDVQFHVFLPPYSAMNYLYELVYQRPYFDARLAFRREVFHRLAALPNCRLYDFEMLEGVACDLNRYKDVVHYDLATNDLILDLIARGDCRVTPVNAPEYLQRFEECVYRFVQIAASSAFPHARELHLPTEEVRQILASRRPAARPIRVANQPPAIQPAHYEDLEFESRPTDAVIERTGLKIEDDGLETGH